jgi:hypothetical protein
MEQYNGWKEWSKHVLLELERLHTQQETLQKEVHKIYIEITILKVKASMWGMIAGCIPAIVIYFIKK